MPSAEGDRLAIDVVAGGVTDWDGDTLLVDLFAGDAEPGGATGAADRALAGAVRHLVALGDHDGSLGTVRTLYPRDALPAKRLLVVGLGAPGDLTADRVRRAAASAARTARELGGGRLGSVVLGAGTGRLDPAAAARATVEGTVLGLARAEPGFGVRSFTLLATDDTSLGAVRSGARVGEAAARGAVLARDLVRRPPNQATPEHLAEVAGAIAERHGMTATAHDRAWIEAEGMGALAAVAQAAGFEPRFVVIDHDPLGTEEAPLVLVGKGVTFDSGGLSIKTRAGMATMQMDMAGAAAVLGAMDALGALHAAGVEGASRRVVALVPATENLLDARGFRPTDVVRAANGVTIEIVSTDAEGRLLLADALSYAQRLRPRAVVDIATLTGGVVTALGAQAAGLFTGDDGLAASLLRAADATGERVWRLPLWAEYREGLRSDVADLKNSTGSPPGSPCVAAAFLERFTDYPWAHVDIAGVSRWERTDGYLATGPTGFGVRLLLDWILGDASGGGERAQA